MPEMKYIDASAKPDEKHTYAIVEVNSVGLKSKPTAPAPLPYVRLNSAISYEVDPSWPERRKEAPWGAMSGVAVDPQDNVWVLSRSNPFVQVYQADGKFIKSWGEGLLGRAHMLCLDAQGNVWMTDSGRHVRHPVLTGRQAAPHAGHSGRAGLR